MLTYFVFCATLSFRGDFRIENKPNLFHLQAKVGKWYRCICVSFTETLKLGQRANNRNKHKPYFDQCSLWFTTSS